MKPLKNLFLLIILIFNSSCIAQSTSTPLVVGNANVCHSKNLNEGRIVNVYLPENYQLNDSIKYPVIYVLDGGMEEAFLNITDIVCFNTQLWIARFPYELHSTAIHQAVYNAFIKLYPKTAYSH
jgi:hypothetical protein